MAEETPNDWWNNLRDEEKAKVMRKANDQSTSVNISSNVLFHFTKTVEKLISILENGFYPHYCPEYGIYENDEYDIKQKTLPRYAKPMVCFCDLPVFLIRNHCELYGPCGIGMRKTWGIKKRISPVLYAHPEALILEPGRLLLETTELLPDEDDTLRKYVLYLSAYERPYIGSAWRDKRRKDEIRFYNEREWRYVPPFMSIDKFAFTKEEYQVDHIMDEANAKLKQKFPIPFNAVDVLYTIVEKEADVHEMIKKLRELKRVGGKNVDADKDIPLLETTVSSAERILED